MSQWELVDCLEALEEDQDNPKVAIDSEARLRERLQHWQHRKLGHIILRSPDGDRLSFSIGGPFGGMGWLPPPEKRREVGQRIAVADRRCATAPVDCWGEGIPTPINPEHLFPTVQVIEAAIYFYKHHQLPGWISWQEWNPATMQWSVRPGKEAVQPASAS